MRVSALLLLWIGLVLETSAWIRPQQHQSARWLTPSAAFSNLHPYSHEADRGSPGGPPCQGLLLKEAAMGCQDTEQQSCKPEKSLPRFIEGMEVVYEDTDLVVVNKPAGSPVCPPPSNSGISLKPTSITERLLRHYKASDSPETFRLFAQEVLNVNKSNEDEGVSAAVSPVVHRLDEGTSGVLMLAKTAEAGHSLRQQFKERSVKKIYFAIVLQGGLKKPMTVTSGVGRNSTNRRKMQTFTELPGVCTAGGVQPETAKVRGAVTLFKPLIYNGKFGVLMASPITGRTHQIRLHLQMLKTPIIGDQLYGDPAATSRFFACMRSQRGPHQGPPREGRAMQQGERGPPVGAPLIPRPLLHAAKLCCVHPRTGAALELSASLPLDMREALRVVDPLWASVPELKPFEKAHY
ncbi:hypothetical protein Emed_006810 [Eimeria media]